MSSSGMGSNRRLFGLLPLSLVACNVSTDAVRNSEQPAKEAGLLIASLCVKPQRWPVLVERMRRYGQKHNLELHGGIEPDDFRPSHKQLNVLLAQGYSYYFGDDFDLWVVGVSAPSLLVSLSAIPRHMPVSHEQNQLALGLLAEIKDLGHRATKKGIEASCR